MKFKRILCLLAFVLLYQESIAQIDINYTGNCYKIRFVKKDVVVPDSLIIPGFNYHGFELIENGVYDLIVDGEKYFQSLIFKIDSGGFYISERWSFINGIEIIPDTVFVQATQVIEVRLLMIDKGLAGLPFRARNENYEVTFAEAKKYCRVRTARIAEGNTPDGHYYFTGFGWKLIRMKNGKPYFVDNNIEFKLRRN